MQILMKRLQSTMVFWLCLVLCQVQLVSRAQYGLLTALLQYLTILLDYNNY